MTIRLLATVANDPKGAVLSVSEDRATRLIRTGYAVAVVEDEKPPKKRKE
jgi:hypothetical protein